MRTNIEINDEIMTDVLRRSGAKTKREAVDRALRSYQRLLLQASIRDLRGIARWEGELDEMRASRFPDRTDDDARR